jgi:hypothetical protein
MGSMDLLEKLIYLLCVYLLFQKYQEIGNFG